METSNNPLSHWDAYMDVVGSRATQDDKLLLRLLHSVRPILQQLPRGLG
jgi:hypothetical protein